MFGLLAVETPDINLLGKRVCLHVRTERLACRTALSVLFFARNPVRFKVPPGPTNEGGDTFRDSHVHPAERCVHCYTPQEGSDSSAAAAAATRHRCMKTEGRRPSARFSACRSAVVKQSKRHKVLPRFELAEEKCCVMPADSESFTGMAAEYPYFHAEARRPGVSSGVNVSYNRLRVRHRDFFVEELHKEFHNDRKTSRSRYCNHSSRRDVSKS